MDLVGTGFKVFGKIAAGNAEKRDKDREAAQLRREAGHRRAEGTLAAQEESRQARLVASRARALMAASGAGTDNIDAVNIEGDINAEGVYRGLIRRYSAGREAQGLEDEAMNRNLAGKAARRGSRISAATTLFTDGEDLWKKYT